MRSTTWYEQFLLGTRRRCYIVMLVKLAQAVLEKMFKGKYVIDPPTRDPLGSKTWYEQFLSGTYRICDIGSLVKIGLVDLKMFFCLFIIIFLFLFVIPQAL